VHQSIRRDSTYVVGKSTKPKLYNLDCWLSSQVESHLTQQDVTKKDNWLHSSQPHSCSVTKVYMNSVQNKWLCLLQRLFELDEIHHEWTSFNECAWNLKELVCKDGSWPELAQCLVLWWASVITGSDTRELVG
jgi:hypothetical protein